MKWFNLWFKKKCIQAWESEGQDYAINKQMNTLGAAQIVEKGKAEGNNRITFELTSAVGGKILNVRHYDERKDRHEAQTYVIPTGEDVGERVAKIINLEMFRQ